MGTTPQSTLGGIALAIAGFQDALEVGGAEQSFIPTHDSSHFHGKFLPWLLAFPRLIVARVRFRPHVVWLHSGAGPSMVRISLIALMCRLLGLPTLWHLHSPTVDDWLKGSTRRRLFRCMVASAGTLAVLTPWWRDRLRAAEVTKEVVVLSNVVSSELIKRSAGKAASSGQPHCVVLTSCRLVEGKGADRLIRGIALCHEPVRLVIAGDGPLRASLERLANELDVASQVTFLGWLGQRELLAAREAADVFALVSTFDSFGMGYIEAMASGMPIVAARWQAIPDVVTEGTIGVLVDPDRDCETAAAIDSLAADACLRDRLGKQGQLDVSSRWSPQARAPEIQSVFATLVAGRS
jgi:glycosyltransferase involved in cell wall biosynthesis